MAGLAAAIGAAAATAYLLVGGLPGVLYAAGIVLLGIFLVVRFGAGVSKPERDVLTAAGRRRWRRKSMIIAELEAELAEAERQLEERLQALAVLDQRLAREAEAARATQVSLDSRILELEAERNRASVLLRQERAKFEQSMTDLTGGIAHRGSELEALERELEAIIAG